MPRKSLCMWFLAHRSGWQETDPTPTRFWGTCFLCKARAQLAKTPPCATPAQKELPPTWLTWLWRTMGQSDSPRRQSQEPQRTGEKGSPENRRGSGSSQESYINSKVSAGFDSSHWPVTAVPFSPSEGEPWFTYPVPAPSLHTARYTNLLFQFTDYWATRASHLRARKKTTHHPETLDSELDA
jgi:hypothetical protein